MRSSLKALWVVLFGLATLLVTTGADCDVWLGREPDEGDLSDEFDEFWDDVEDAF